MLSETLVTVDGKVMVGKPEHPLKALAPMLVTVFGMETLVIPVRFINALAAIVVTLNVSVASVTVDWIVMEPVADALFDASTVAVFVAAPGVNE